ncbi:MAG: EFR1 family ferrodoxin [Clostridia bacterium]|nr:EFR1 family ferrodoxin [Clostridia bacterium]
MDIKKVYSLAFSPVGKTEMTVRIIAETLAEKLGVCAEHIDFTLPAQRMSEHTFGVDELVVIGAPTYAGKLPNKVLPDFQNKLRGKGTIVVGVVTFGNRAYDNSLAELCAVLERNDFRIVAAGAFVCRHVFSKKLAEGRPNRQDVTQMVSFVEEIVKKLLIMEGNATSIRVPGDSKAPYYKPLGLEGEEVNFLKAKPIVDESQCNNCGMCARVCPMGIISSTEGVNINGSCIKCFACIMKCPAQAIYFDDADFKSHVAMLEGKYTDHKDNAFFIK